VSFSPGASGDGGICTGLPSQYQARMMMAAATPKRPKGKSRKAGGIHAPVVKDRYRLACVPAGAKRKGLKQRIRRALDINRNFLHA
jgi:hypothetical protein